MSAPADPKRTPWPWLAVLFFVSGAIGLAYEVAWSRGLLLVLGSTASASAIVLGVFVGGLGLGARWGGPRAERHARPLVFYGQLEIAAAVWAVLSLLLLPLLETPYVALVAGAPEFLRFLARGIVAALVVLPASFLLGATLPAMVREAVVGEDQTGRRTAWLYGLNTVGAVIGCLVTGYFGVAAIGVVGVLWVAAGVGVLVGVAAIAIAAGGSSRDVETAPSTDDVRLSPVFAVALLCGFVGLGVEIVGFRVLVFFVEGFTATFASMLGVFIAGLGLGSLVLGFLAKTDRPARVLGVLLLVESVLLIVALYVVVPNLEDWMRSIKASAYAEASTPESIAAALRWSSFLGSALLLFLPAFFLGPTFPLCVRWAEKAGATPGEAVGQTYLGNSIGSLLAPLVVTFAVIPVTGVLGAWMVVLALALMVGLHLLIAPTGKRAAIGWVVVFATVVFVPLMNLPGTGTPTLLESSVVLHDRPDRTLVDHQTDSVTTASVIETTGGERILYTDDFAAAATGRYYRYMRMLGHLPTLLAKDPENAMVIAFGTGTTAGAVAEHPRVKRLEVVEVSRAVLDLAHHFDAANRDVLNDPRVRVIEDDGRNALLLHEPDLDVITLEPLMPYSPAGLPFYTREFYELARDRLREGGVVCQWIPVHAMSADLYAAFAKTFFEVFPEGTFWFFEQSTALIGRKGTAQPSPEALRVRVASIFGDLQDAGFEDAWTFVSGYVATGRDVLEAPMPLGDQARFVGRPVRDADPFPEFEPTPRAGLNTTYLIDTLGWLRSLVTPLPPDDRSWWVDTLQVDTRRQMNMALYARVLDAESAYHRVFAEAASLPTDMRAAHLRRAIEAADEAALAYEEGPPRDAVLKRRRLKNLRFGATTRARALLQRALQVPAGQQQELMVQAADLMKSVLPPVEPDPEPSATDRANTATVLAVAQLWLGRCDAALTTLRAAQSALEQDGAPNALSVLSAFETYARGDRVTEPAWIFQAGAYPPPCREEGLAPVQREWDAFVAKFESGELVGLGGALGRLERAASREDAQRAVAEALEPLVNVNSLANVLIDASHHRLMGRPFGMDDPLARALRTTAPGMRHVAMEEIARRKTLDAYGELGLMMAKDPDAGVRRAFVRAAAAESDRVYRCATADLLMDADVEVRKEAVSALFTHTGELARYDPEASAAARKPVADAAKADLGCD